MVGLARPCAPVAVTPAVVPALAFDHVSIAFDDVVVLRDVTFSLPPGTMTVLIGASGAGKSVVLKLASGLMKPDSGSIRVFGERIDTMGEAELRRVRGRIGMLFQENALFDSLTVADNVGYRLTEETETPPDMIRQRVEEALHVVSLEEYAARLPSELSGGQRRRVALARAIAAWPELLLLDDPTSGLDPITARSVADQIVMLRDREHLTSICVTHQLPDAFYVAEHMAAEIAGQTTVVKAPPDRCAQTTFMMLRGGGIYFQGSGDALRASRDPYLHAFMSGWIPPLI